MMYKDCITLVEINEMNQFAQRPIAWVTGASSGIGAALVTQLAAAGWQVIASARSQDALHRLAEANAAITPLPLDVTDLAAVRAAVQQIETQHGAIDTAFLNAGDYKPMALDDFDVALFEHLMQVNFMGVVHGLDALRHPCASAVVGKF